ncbi:Hypothetical predicted protein [Marmota monax]|uniref:Uncharacterized protein n=1 Tax=Marmota monax TaxID=9995 RepID=A0A5E4BXQ1_MARMO|nr:Hypothetical predicted protein [Marmota monax]
MGLQGCAGRAPGTPGRALGRPPPPRQCLTPGAARACAPRDPSALSRPARGGAEPPGRGAGLGGGLWGQAWASTCSPRTSHLLRVSVELLQNTKLGAGDPDPGPAIPPSPPRIAVVGPRWRCCVFGGH